MINFVFAVRSACFISVLHGTVSCVPLMVCSSFSFFGGHLGGYFSIFFQELMPFLEPIKISCKGWKYEFPIPHVGHGLVPQVAWTWTFTWLDLRGNGCQVTTHRKWRVTSVFLWHPDNTPWFVKSNPQNISEYKRMCDVHIGQKG